MFYVRADANEIIGTGHVMRCLSIAEEMRKQDQDVTFIIADDRSERLIVEKGFDCICLNSVWDDLEQEIDILSQVIKERNIQSLLIDTYYVTQRYLDELRKYLRTIYIDDLMAFPYSVDMLINYNIFADVEKYKELYENAYDNTEFVLGCEYAALREEFSYCERTISDNVKRILITSGGTDQYDLIGHLLNGLRHQSWFQDTEVHVIMGRFNVNKERLEKEWIGCSNVKLHFNVSNMSDYMKMCDIAVSAGGVTTYELCACGIPAIMFTLADNQLEIVNEVERRELMYYAGDVRSHIELCVNNILTRMNELRVDVGLRKKRSALMMQTVDGNGCKRLVEKICGMVKEEGYV